jgi:hypothetical protein
MSKPSRANMKKNLASIPVLIVPPISATSGFYDSWITPDASGKASISAIACAGTNLARCPQNRSV